MGKVLNQVLRPCTDKVQGVYANAGKTDQGTGYKSNNPDIALAIQNNERLIQEQKEAYSVYKNVINLACQAFISSKSDEEIRLSPDPERILIKKDPEVVIYEPKSYKEAINSPYKDYWLKAINKEIASLENHNTWKVVDSNTKTIKLLKTRWVYKIKELESEYYEFKARFVAKGFEQLYGINYLDTYASVVKQMA
ncbi:uncharacterized protein RCO7_03767 [Rhynchosporium graminicola]|uniref:Reverse transcriptase Ty1/copia-type domain-containing protein n=1 Tax=Rhynchosporium graminicola TaxID=2792576 RepID=A0A1E1K1R3_9HELO|nr:uncharacterized protein RCO7_03767 [Rhynchosporium commune]